MSVTRRPVDFETSDCLEFNFFPNSTGLFQFRVKAPNDAHIALTTTAAEEEPMYEIIIGGWSNTKSVIRKNRIKTIEVVTPCILSECEFRGFKIEWQNGVISVSRENEEISFLSWTDNEVIDIEFVGVCTGWGARGFWILELLGYAKCTTASASWIKANHGELPPTAFAGGTDNGQPVYVIRARFNDELLPGKLVPSDGKGYVPWGGAAHPIYNYEVLCDFSGSWQTTCGANIPSNALAAGETQNGEPLYIGRVLHEGVLSVGKICQSNGTCYIPYQGKELSFLEYEILVL